MRVNVVAIIIIFSCVVISVNALRSIVDSYNVGTIYDNRKIQIQQQYIELIKKKNELDYINTPFFAEKQLRESLNYYKRGERLVVFTQKLDMIVNLEKKEEKQDIKQIWWDTLINGIKTPKI